MASSSEVSNPSWRPKLVLASASPRRLALLQQRYTNNQPTQVEVILPVPNKPDVEPSKRLLTLTTCNPRWASYERLIFHATLTDVLPKGEGRPAVLGGT